VVSRARIPCMKLGSPTQPSTNEDFLMQLHPLCTLFPRITGYDFECLKTDIKENGLRTPISTYQGMILDGGNRYAACIDIGINPTFEEFVGDNISAFVITSNLHRRHLTPGQQAALVACVQDWDRARKAGGNGSNQHKEQIVTNGTLLDTTKSRAKQSGTSINTQRKADAVAKANPVLAAKVARGETSLNEATREVAPQLAPKKPEHDEPEYTELDAAHDQITDLQDLLASSGYSETDSKQHISDMRKEIKTLRAELSAVKSMRDTLQNENAALKKQCMTQARKLKKYEGHGN